MWKWWIRIGSIILTALFAVNTINVILAFTYQIPFEFTFTDFWTGVIASTLILETIRFVNKKLNKRFPWTGVIWKRIVTQFIVDSLVCSILLSISAFIIASYFVPNSDFTNRNWPVIINELVLYNTVVLVLVAIIVLIDLGVYLVIEWKNSLLEIAQFKKENAEFRFEALKNQVNPHFLFNSLNTLSSLIFIDQENAAKYVRQLAKLYRYILEKRDRELVELETELEMLDSYIYLIATRFDKQVYIKTELPEFPDKKFIPILTLQMLIENAIKHNTTSHAAPLKINIYLEDQYIVVENNLQQKTSKEFSSGIGLTNITSRYQYFSKEQVIIVKDLKYFMVKVPPISNL